MRCLSLTNPIGKHLMLLKPASGFLLQGIWGEGMQNSCWLRSPPPPQNGFDYLLTYSDNPQTVFPRYCLSWMVSSGE